MGIRDEMRSGYGDDFFHPSSDREPYHNWHELCVCGHLDRYHSPSVGGTYRLTETRTQVIRGEDVTVTTAFLGCVGAMPGRGFEAETLTVDHEARTMVTRINPTCPCESFTPVARLDRPNRFFNQRLPRDRNDHARHPMAVGVRAFLTHLSKRKAAVTDPDWVDLEFDRRFVWIPKKRRCGLSKCAETADVWPVFVDGERSELRCGPHRSRP